MIERTDFETTVLDRPGRRVTVHGRSTRLVLGRRAGFVLERARPTVVTEWRGAARSVQRIVDPSRAVRLVAAVLFTLLTFGRRSSS